jgi:N-acetylglucosaminyldiphosphoundecaprenol N-acetyl-beta-D-mannosaminyltransferase
MKSSDSIFSVRIDNITRDEIFVYAQGFLSSDAYHHIVTLNPEILLKSRYNRSYKNILNASALNIVDGIGIRFALLRHGKHLKSRCTGVELMHIVLKVINRRSGKVFLVVNQRGLSDWKEVKRELKTLYPRISFNGQNIDPSKYGKIFNSIDEMDVVLCNFGAPEQEQFLCKLTSRHAKMGIGIGGAFDYLTGAMPRAPKWMRAIGMEWLYRLCRQPHRWKRIYNAVIVFPLLILCNKE